jgi:hypothetical protein
MMGFSFSLAPLTQDAAKQMVRASAAHAEMEVEPAAMDLLVAAPAAMVPFVSGPPGVHPLFAKLAAEANLRSITRLTVWATSTRTCSFAGIHCC